MARVSHTSDSGKTQNPTNIFLEYKSSKKTFSSYNRSNGAKEDLKLPFKFVFLQNYHTVRGWDDSSDSGIYSNEVYYIGKEVMRVRSKSGLIAEGIYKDIKNEVRDAGGKYNRSIYIMLEGGDVANIQLKGSAVKSWGDFITENAKLVDNQWIEVNKVENKKKGSVKYTVPVFELGASLSEDDSNLADTVADELQSYFDDYFSKAEDQGKEVPTEEFEEPDLDF